MKKFVLPFLILLLLVTPAFAIDVTWDGTQYICSPTNIPPQPPNPCTYGYSAWVPPICPSNGTQTRTVTSYGPNGCVGTPVLTQPCTYVPPPPTGCSPPVGAQELALNTRLYFNPGVGETSYSVSIVDGMNITRLQGQIAGLSGGTDVVVAWIMPDCNHFEAYAEGTDNGANIDIRSKSSIQPNINYTFVPVGKHTVRIKANQPSSILLKFLTYP